MTSRKNNRDLCWRHRHTSFILNLFSPEGERERGMAWLFMPILRSGLRTFNESVEERGDRGSSISAVYAGQGRGAANRYWLDVLSSSSDFARQERGGGEGVERGTREVSETTSGEANFSSRFSRIILEKKGLSIQSFPTAGARISSRFTWSGFERGDGRPSGLPASKGIWILVVSSNLYVPRWNVPCVLLRTEHKAHRGTR